MNDITKKLSLRWQISILMAVALILSLVIIGYFTFQQSRSVVIEQTKDSMMAKTNEAAARVEQLLLATRADAVATPNFPPIPGMIRCWDNNGQDPVQTDSTTELWIDRLRNILREQMKVHKIRLYCDVFNDQREPVMRVTREGNVIVLQTTNLDAAPEATTEFFEKAKDLNEPKDVWKPRPIYVSPMTLSGKKPIVRVCRPFFQKGKNGVSGEFRGVFVITLDGEKILQHAADAIGVDTSRLANSEEQTRSIWTDIIDENGVYLHCEDKDSPTLFSNKDEDNYEAKKPVRAKLLKQSEPEFDTYKSYIAGNERSGASLIATYKKVYYNKPEDDQRFWAIATNETSDTALAPVHELGRGYLLLGLLVLVGAGIVTFFAASGLTSSLKTLADVADEIAGGDLNAELPNVRPIGEVGKLHDSFRSMTENLRTTIENVRDQKARTQAILDSTADSIVTIDERGNILSSNVATDRIFGCTKEEIAGRKASVLAPALCNEDAHYDNGDLALGETRSLGPESEVHGTRQDGTRIPIALRVYEMNYGGEKLFIATMRDITARKHAEEERARLFDAIRDAVHRLATASQQILSTTSQQAAGTQQQATSVSETVTTAEEIAAIAKQSVQRADEVAESARQTGQVGSAGRDAIEESIRAMQDVKEQVESLAENILSLAERAQAIGEITATVNDIAEQSNVLALNAAVEASRAGEHGKGFAVVASEVKSLAEQSKKATAQVRQILGEIQQATNNAVLSTEQGTRAVTSANEVIAKAGETINALASTIAASAKTGTQIAASANQQAAGVEQLHDGIRNIDNVTRQNLEAIRQVENAAQNLNALSNELASLVN